MKPASRIYSILLLSLTLCACGKSKIEQCNAFIDRAGKAQAAINALNLASDDRKELEKGAATIDAEAKSFATFELKDEKLVGFRTSYANTLGEMGKIMGNLAAAQAEAAEPAKAEAAAAKVKGLVESAEALEKSESALVDQINGYCGGK
jgi:major membrane immunogen (membrane-anchored lipoprotein)